MLEIMLSLGLFIIVAIVCFIDYKIGRVNQVEYDEMQLFHRGIAYKKSFFTLIIYNCFYGLFIELFNYQIFDTYTTSAFFGILISLLIFATYSIKNNAYVPLKEKSKEIIGWGLFLGLLSLVVGIYRFIISDFITTKLIDFDSLNILSGIILIVISIQIFYKEKTNKSKEDKDEDEKEE